MTCRSTATSPCIWQQLLLLVLQRELARLPLLPLGGVLLHLPLQVQDWDRFVDLRAERSALARRDALRRNADLRACGLELPAGRADVVENRRGVGEVGVDLAGLDRCRGAR